MKTYLLVYLLLGPLVANSIQDQKINFFGFWHLDANKSISENKFLDSFKDHVQHKSRHIVTFSIDGSYQEKIGDVVRTGTKQKRIGRTFRTVGIFQLAGSDYEQPEEFDDVITDW